MTTSSGKPPKDWGSSLTSQEKKVLGFVLALALLGLVMLGWKGWRGPGRPSAPATVPLAVSSKDKGFK